jgi:co-chaperonin GroES (HSP10)
MTPARIRLLRGQVVIRESHPGRFGSILVPHSYCDEHGREHKAHRGVVLAMGSPALAEDGRTEVQPQFDVGDEVFFHWEHHEKAHTRPWPPDGLNACWVPQHCVDAVVAWAEP